MQDRLWEVKRKYVLVLDKQMFMFLTPAERRKLIILADLPNLHFFA